MDVKTSYTATLERELMMTTSAIRNLRNMMKQELQDGFGAKRKKSKWSKPMRTEAAMLRNRIDSMLGTLTIILSMVASNEELPVRISADDSKQALAAIAIEETKEFNLEASLACYDSMAIQFISDICHGEQNVDWHRCANYIQESLMLSSMLTMD